MNLFYIGDMGKALQVSLSNGGRDTISATEHHNQRNVVSDVTKNLTACEEFMELVTVAHVISAAIHSEGVRDIKELSTKILSCDDQLAAVTSTAKTLCSQKVCVAFSTVSKRNTGTTDHVLEYAKETMSLGLLLLELKDAIREGDGTRILRCWKYFCIYILSYIKTTVLRHLTFSCNVTTPCLQACIQCI